MPDHIEFGDDSEDFQSEHKNQFDGRMAERTIKARPGTTLTREGDMDWKTQKNSDFKYQDGQRASNARPSTSLVREGDMDLKTHKNSEYQYVEVAKQGPAKVQDNLKPLEGKLKGKSETQKQYEWKGGERSQMARPETAMLREGDFDWQTNKKSDFKGHEVKKQERSKVGDNLKLFEGKFSDETVSKNEYNGKQSDRTSKARPNTSMLREGDFDWDTQKKMDFKHHELKRQEKLKAQVNSFYPYRYIFLNAGSLNNKTFGLFCTCSTATRLVCQCQSLSPLSKGSD